MDASYQGGYTGQSQNFPSSDDASGRQSMDVQGMANEDMLNAAMDMGMGFDMSASQAVEDRKSVV